MLVINNIKIRNLHNTKQELNTKKINEKIILQKKLEKDVPFNLLKSK